jgi:hypothetical protein
MRTCVLAGAALLALAGCNRPAGNAAAVNATAPAPAAHAGSNAAVPAPTGGGSGYAASLDARWPQGQAVTPAEARQLVDRQGGGEAAVALEGRSAPNRWATVLRGIAMGDPAWMDVAMALAPGIDGAPAEAFNMAVSDALTANASGALRIVGTGGAATYCKDNGTEEARSGAFYQAAISAVDAVSDPALQAAKASCLANLRAEQGKLGQPG